MAHLWFKVPVGDLAGVDIHDSLADLICEVARHPFASRPISAQYRRGSKHTDPLAVVGVRHVSPEISTVHVF
jgi:hypothetical protein